MKDRLRRARERLLADSATTRRNLADANRRVRLEPMADGQAAIEIVGGATGWVPVDHALTAAAVAAKGAPGETRSIGQLRHDILLDIVTEGLKAGALPDPATKVGQRKGVAVELLLTIPVLSLLGKDTALASIEGYGPIDLDKARELAAEAPSFVRVLTHPVTGVRLTMDRTTYRPPADLRRWVRVRDQECRDPGCRRPAGHTDRDHVREWPGRIGHLDQSVGSHDHRPSARPRRPCPTVAPHPRRSGRLPVLTGRRHHVAGSAPSGTASGRSTVVVSGTT